MVLCWRDTTRWHVVLVVVLVLDPLVSVLHPNFDYEDDDEDEKLSTGHFRHSPLMSLHSNCPAGAIFSERSLGKSLVAGQFLQRDRKFIFQIVTRPIFILIGPIIAQLMHPEFRFWWCFGPFYI